MFFGDIIYIYHQKTGILRCFCFCLVKGVICYLPPFTRIRKILKRCFSNKQQQKARKKRMTWWLGLEPVVPGSDWFSPHAKVCAWLSFLFVFLKEESTTTPLVFFCFLRSSNQVFVSVLRLKFAQAPDLCMWTIDNRKVWSNSLWSFFLLTIGDYPAGWSKVFPLKVYGLV